MYAPPETRFFVHIYGHWIDGLSFWIIHSVLIANNTLQHFNGGLL